MSLTEDQRRDGNRLANGTVGRVFAGIGGADDGRDVRKSESSNHECQPTQLPWCVRPGAQPRLGPIPEALSKLLACGRVKALRRLTVRAALPPQLDQLVQLVENLRWSWHPESLDLLESVDPQLWRACNGDPRRMLGEVSADRINKLAKDRKSLRRLADVHDDLTDYLAAPRWYQTQQEA